LLQYANQVLVPPRIARNRSIAFGAVYAFFIGAAFFLFVYYLPYYFQAIKNVSALRSGIDVLPLILSQVVGTILAGVLTTRIGYYVPFMYLGAVFMAIGAGLLTLLEIDTPTKDWIGYQIIFGLGAGFGFQQVTLAAQGALERKDVPTGTGIAMFIQLFGGALFVSVGLNVFTNKLVSGIVDAQIPGLDPSQIIALGATQLRQIVPPEYVQTVLEIFRNSLSKAYQVGIIVSCLSIFGAAGMEWINVKGKQLDSMAV
jgi:hypothetical protein